MRLASLAVLPIVLLLAQAALAADEVSVLRGKRILTGLSGTGAGGSIERLEVELDLSVANLAYAKTVGVRFTWDDWKTSAEATGYWVETFADGREHWRVKIDGGTVGRYVVVNGGRGDMGPVFLRYAAFARMNGASSWDNAGGRDHAVAILAPSAEPLPETRTAPRTALVNGTFYLVGGQQTESYRFTVPNVLRLDGDRWTKVAEIPSFPDNGVSGPPTSPTILVGYEVVALGNALHVLGGTRIKVGGHPLENLALDVATGTWTTKAPLPGPLVGRTAIASGTEIHLVPTSAGNALQPGASDELWVYDSKKDAWSREKLSGLAQLTASGHATATAGGKLWFVGGSLAGAPANDLLAYDPKTRTLTRLAKPTFPVQPGARAVALGASKLLVANANPDLSRGTSDALVLDTLAGAWTRLSNRPFFGYDQTLAAAPAALVAPAGSGAGRTVESCFVFGPTTRVDTWEPTADVLTRGLARTVLRVHADVGVGHEVTVRGSASPLSWASGTDARWTDGNTWVLDTTEVLDPSFRWKPLVDDRTWRSGDDVRTRPGETVTVEGLFR